MPTHLLSQNELGILVVGILASFELSDLDILLLEFFVVALFFFDEAVEHRGGDCELRWGGHFGFDLFLSIGGIGMFRCLIMHVYGLMFQSRSGRVSYRLS